MAALAGLVKNLQGLERQLEAILWQSVALIHHGGSSAEIGNLSSQMRTVIQRGTAFPRADSVLCGLDVDRFSRAKLAPVAVVTANRNTNQQETFIPDSAAFDNISADLGLNQTYKVGTAKQTQAFAIYQQYGGGVAVLDYDLDDDVDLYFAQGAADAPGFVAKESNQLYRNIRSPKQTKLQNVAAPANVIDNRYSLGVTAGDWNQDGFPELVVANIGANSLLLNNGDGTFDEQPLEDQPSLTTMSSSIAMGDVSGDQLPDLFVSSYVDYETIGLKPQVNTDGFIEAARTPFNHQPALDDIYTNDGRGGWVKSKIGSGSQDASYGLGVVMTDMTASPENELFIGNDGKANQLWCRSTSPSQPVD